MISSTQREVAHVMQSRGSEAEVENAIVALGLNRTNANPRRRRHD
jgi:hypothetical protein